MDDLLLVHSGFTIYCGPVGEVSRYFREYLGISKTPSVPTSEFIVDQLDRLGLGTTDTLATVCADLHRLCV